MNGGQAVLGYELWMDAWSGGGTFMVYDGAGSPDDMQYWLTTSDVSVHSQIVETGRQYRFQVRAVNICDTEDPSRSCFGGFSKVQVFTVRLLMPQRNSRTCVTSLNEATKSVLWSPPVDNGGSPITGSILFMKDHNGTVTNKLFCHETTRWKIEALRPGEVYCFHVVAMNAFGKSGNSPVLSVLAAMHLGLSYAGSPEYSKLKYHPVITDVQESLLALKWSPLPSDITEGSPIKGLQTLLVQVCISLASFGC